MHALRASVVVHCRPRCVAICASGSRAAPAEAPSHVWLHARGGRGPSGARAPVRRPASMPPDLDAWLKRLSAEPNHVGSPHDKANAEFVRDLFKSWGWQAEIETFYVLYPDAEARGARARRTDEVRRQPCASQPIAGDATSTRTDGLPPYNVYGADGDVTGGAGLRQLRHGRRLQGARATRRRRQGQDRHRALRRRLAWPQAEARLRARRDRLPDLFGPQGRWLFEWATPIPRVAGGPPTPCSAVRWLTCRSTRATRSHRASARPRMPSACRWPKRTTILKIPVLPISYADARPLLEAIGGPGRAREVAWRIADHLSHGSRSGASAPEHRVRLGSEAGVRRHREDSRNRERPMSGSSAAIIATAGCSARGIRCRDTSRCWRKRKRSARCSRAAGDRSARSIYASWDGEEAGLLGSTEWAETHAAGAAAQSGALSEFRHQHARVPAHRGQPFAAAVHQRSRCRACKDPETGAAVQARMRAKMLVAGFEKGATEEQKELARQAAERADVPVGAMGSGSDYTPFIQHLGITVARRFLLGRGRSGTASTTLYTTRTTTMRDSAIRASRTACWKHRRSGARCCAWRTSMCCRCSSKDSPPPIDDYRAGVAQAGGRSPQARTGARAAHRSERVHAASDPTRPVLAPEREPEVPYIDFAPLDNVVVRLKKSAADL